jgi:hypothetical protein
MHKVGFGIAAMPYDNAKTALGQAAPLAGAAVGMDGCIGTKEIVSCVIVAAIALRRGGNAGMGGLIWAGDADLGLRSVQYW